MNVDQISGFAGLSWDNRKPGKAFRPYKSRLKETIGYVEKVVPFVSLALAVI